MQRLHAGAKLPVTAYDRTERDRSSPTGTLATVDNQIDTTTGTVKLRASSPTTTRPCSRTSSSMSGCWSTRCEDAPIVPTAAVQRGAPGTFVYVVRPDNTVTVRPVKPARATASGVAVDGRPASRASAW